GVKAFMFHEGQDSVAQHAYREIARLTGGAYAAFDATAPQRLAELLAAAAAYAVGGRRELERRADEGEGAARLLLSQIG
ncbi:MAG: VWA domain-containing protein, partial [Methylocystis sp.]